MPLLSRIWSRSFFLPFLCFAFIVMSATMGCKLALADPTTDPVAETPATPATPETPLTPATPDPVPVTVTVEYPSDLSVTATVDDQTKADIVSIRDSASLTADLVVILVSLAGAILGALFLFHFWAVVARG